MNQLETKVFQEYKQWIKSGNCQNCNNHDKELPSNRERIGPVSYFNIGENYDNKTNSIRLCFVGKAAHSTKEGIRNDSLPPIDGFYYAKEWGKYFYENRIPPYWSFIGRITDKLGLTLDDIAFTNLVKCNENLIVEKTTKDITSDYYYEQCIKLFEKEILTLQPTHLVLFTGWRYDYLLRNLTFGYSIFKDIRDEDYKKKIKKDKGYFSPAWWHRNFGDEKMHMLRTRHPERCPLPLVDAIVEWVKATIKN